MNMLAQKQTRNELLTHGTDIIKSLNLSHSSTVYILHY